MAIRVLPWWWKYPRTISKAKFDVFVRCIEEIVIRQYFDKAKKNIESFGTSALIALLKDITLDRHMYI